MAVSGTLSDDCPEGFEHDFGSAPMKRRSVLFDGWYGQMNTGDDAYCLVAAHVALMEWGLGTLRFVGRPSLLPTLPASAIGVTPEHPIVKGQTRMSHWAAAVRSRNVIQFGGSRFRKPLRSHRDLARGKRLGLLELAAASISIGPFDSVADAQAIARMLGNFDHVSVRDSASQDRAYELVPSANVHRGFDAAILLPDAIGWAGTSHTGSRPVVGVSVCPSQFVQGGESCADEERLERISKVLLEVARRTDCSVRLLTMCGHPKWGDRHITDRLLHRLGDSVEVSVQPYSRDTSRMLSAIATCDAIVAMRLHAAVFAFAAGVPFFVAPYDRKCIDFAREVALPEAAVFPIVGPELWRADAIVQTLHSTEKQLPGLSLADAHDRAWHGLRLVRPADDAPA